ncbi:hypothetical protein FA13DRAFT_1792740 [Coprinellus micaceus]|uniref:Uncharacterized protein n=1 Tax=Coprinellus micaceus TaxID=71717 RepID=A0A4Y7T6I6_COPMI|nr:hypothetical protein FA13DRAFT_1792740 [Coprinellus micaceus]
MLLLVQDGVAIGFLWTGASPTEDQPLRKQQNLGAGDDLMTPTKTRLKPECPNLELGDEASRDLEMLAFEVLPCSGKALPLRRDIIKAGRGGYRSLPKTDVELTRLRAIIVAFSPSTPLAVATPFPKYANESDHHTNLTPASSLPIPLSPRVIDPPSFLVLPPRRSECLSAVLNALPPRSLKTPHCTLL